MKLKALVTAEVIKPIIETLSDKIDFEYDGYCLDHNVMDRKKLMEKIEDKDILICEYDTIDAEIFEHAKNLKFIVCCRGGIKTVVDLKKAEEMGIVVCNNAGRNANAVSDMTMGFILDMTRNIALTNSLIHNRVITTDVKSKPDEYKDTVWGLDNNSPFIRFRGDSVNHMTLGIVGFGCAGRLVAKKANAFDMNIIAYDPFVKEDTVPDYVKIVSFDELLKTADIVTLHCVVSDSTRGMFKKKQFDAMKDGAYFINTARGELIDENDLIEALKSKKLSAAALDVTAVEPIASNHPLVDVDNLLVTPHIAGSALDVQVQGSNMVVDSLNEWLDGKRPKFCVVG